MATELTSPVVAMEEAGEIAASSREDGTGGVWDCLEDFSAVADMASKAELLRSLSIFLSCVATTMSFSPEFNTLSARGGSSAVLLGHKEVAQLHELVVRELKDQTNFLSTLSWICSRKTEEGVDGDFTRVLNLKIVSQTLRCCIRILPLVDCFDKNASLASAKLLDGILQQLCNPTKLFHLLGLKASGGMPRERNDQTAQGDVDGTYFHKTGSHEGWMANILDMDSHHRKELIFAILEVYLDELLLHPDLISRLLMSREDTCRPFAHEQMTCRVKHTEASLEAAFIHVVLSLYSAVFRQASPVLRRKGFLVGNLSLPAGLILLEKFSSEEVPPFYLAQIVRLLATILKDTASVSFVQFDDLSRKRPILVKNCWAGGVDWSYCSQELLPNLDSNDGHCLTGSLPSETTLNFASSILEQAILLYSRISSGPARCHTLENSLLEFYLSKYTPFFDVLVEGPELNTMGGVSGSGDSGIGHVHLNRDDYQCYSNGALVTERDFYLEDGTGTVGFAGQLVHQYLAAGFHCGERNNNVVFDEEEVKDTSGLVVVLLQLMSCALKCIGREVRTSIWLTDAFGDPVLNPKAMSSSDPNQADFDKILQCVGLYLSLCFPATTDLFSMYHERQCGRAGQNGGDTNPPVSPRGSLNNLVGQAILCFTKVLHGEVRRGAPDEILEEYFHLVKSLVALLLALDERNDHRNSTLECNLIRNCTQCDGICRPSLEASGCGKCKRSSSFENGVQQQPDPDSTSSYLDEMVLHLRGMLQDLSEQQRRLPEFFLLFILKQLSTSDALSLVTMAFSSCLHNQSDVLQTITSTELFQTEGLVTDVLRLALSEPTKPCSLVTFVIYMVDSLEEELSITAALSSSGMAEPISWFETIAYILTLASQLVVCEQRMFVRNGMDFSISFILKISQGVDRIFTEGIAAAHWLSDHCKTMSEASWHKFAVTRYAMGNSTITERYFGGEAGNVTGSLGQCSMFLDQVDMLRNAVEELARSVDSSLDSELTPLLEKGRIFFAAFSELPIEQKLAEFRWSLYLSEQTKQHSRETEPVSHLPTIAVGLECDHTEGHQKVFSSTAEEMQECRNSPRSDATLVGDQTVQTEKVSCGEELSLPIGSHLAGQEDVLIAQSNSTADFFVSSTVVPVEKPSNRPATSLKSYTLDNGLGSEKPQSTSHERKRCSAATSAIIKRLLRKTSPSRGKSTTSYQICTKRPAKVSESIPDMEQTSGQERGSSDFIDDVTDAYGPPSTTANLFVDSLNEKDPSSDSFDDLKDFIVTKKGRDYSVWLKRRQKVRRRLYSKNFFKRLQEKRELLLSLDM